MTDPQRTWLETGRQFREPKGVTDDEVTAEIARLVWHPTTPRPVDVPAVPGLCIQTMIRELRLPKVSQIAWNGTLRTYGLYGIEANYKIGRARIYVLDRGSDACAVVSDYWPKEAL